MQMKARNLLVSFMAIAAVLLLVGTASAAEIADNEVIYINSEVVLVDGVLLDDSVSVIAGETISVRVTFDALENDQDVTVEVEIEGHKIDTRAVTKGFDVEAGKRYNKHLSLEIPYDLKDELSEDAELTVEIDGDKHKTVFSTPIELRVQRPSYNVEIMSIETLQTAEAGQLLPVDIVLKNKGYNDVDDLYVAVKIPALNSERTSYFGDLVAVECDDDNTAEENYGVDIERKCDEDDEDTVSGRIYLQIPDNAKSGVYTLEVSVSGDDVEASKAKQIAVESGFVGENVIASVTGRSAGVGENAEYSILIVNPTNKLKVYKIIPETSSGLFASASESVIAVPAGSSKTITLTASADTEGAYNFNVNVLSGDELVSKVALSLNVEGKKSVSTANPIVVLTVVLAIIFIVLLIVLLVLIGKKPEKAEEFGESYY